MTLTDDLLADALAGIHATQRGHVYASRRGIVAGWRQTNNGIEAVWVLGDVIFRRAAGGLYAEWWSNQSRPGSHEVLERPVPAHLREAVERMLDQL